MNNFEKENLVEFVVYMMGEITSFKIFAEIWASELRYEFYYTDQRRRAGP